MSLCANGAFQLTADRMETGKKFPQPSKTPCRFQILSVMTFHTLIAEQRRSGNELGKKENGKLPAFP